MMSSKWSRSVKQVSWMIAVATFSASYFLTAYAADTNASTSKKKNDDELQEVVVTGSLLPQSQKETATPITIITSADMKQRGFSTLAEALQQSQFSTGSVQGAQYSGGFTPGAKTLSLFGLSPSYVKYLIDGRPMSDYPALYNGTDIITSISGIPEELIDRIEILPGGQSSIYGSDAIAGVVNIVLKKKLDAPVATLDYGFYQHGGGKSWRASLSDDFTIGSFHLLAGIQYQKTAPVWGYQRDLTSQFFANGTSPQTAERDFLVYGYYGTVGDGLTGIYYFEDPRYCGSVAGLYGGTVLKYTRGVRGDYCGTKQTGYETLNNGEDNVQGYLHATLDVGDSSQIYGDLLLDHEITKYSVGQLWWGTSVNYGYYYDPNLDDFVNMQHVFAPEEVGGNDVNLNSNTTNAYYSTVGMKGSLSSNWTYDLSMTRSQQKLTESTHVLWNDAVENFFANILGPDLGPDPYLDYYSTFTPDYAAFYRPVTPAQFASFSGYAKSYSKTWDNVARLQLTDTSLFSLPGGDAGLALVAEGGSQGWNYAPDERFLNGGTWGYTAVAGAGHRSRYAATAELRMPVAKMLTVTTSGRYDSFKVGGDKVDKATYMLGLEFRPINSFLLRGRVGTAFKAPTLSDEFQGESGFYVAANDYWRCEQAGYTGTNIGDCPYNDYVFGTTSGNTKLKPINANVWNIGLVWSPSADFSFTADYLHWSIKDEVTQQSSDQLLRTEMLCRDGTYDINSPTCVAALAQIERDAGNGALVSIYTPKINVSEETLNAVALSARYAVEVGSFGKLIFKAAWNDLLKHSYVQYADDPEIDLLTNATWSTDFKTKANASVTWAKADWDTTFYVNRYGHTPNYLAGLYGYGAVDGADTLPAWTLCNLSVDYQATAGLKLSATIDNMFDKMPPTDNTYPGTEGLPYNIFNYDVYGRKFILSASYKFGQ